MDTKVAENEIRFIHLRPKNKDARGGALSIAYTTMEVETGILVALGVSFCSPSENFNRKLGRKISEGRLRKKPRTFIDTSPEQPEEYAINDVIDGVFAGISFPLWADELEMRGWA